VWLSDKKGEISINTVISIIILLITLIVLFFLITDKFNFMRSIWARGPFG
jgi:hypothetical protein